MINLTAGVVSAGSAAQATDMTGDLKTGYLLRAKPKNQFIAQLTGSVVAIFLNVGLFILFTTATPCILWVLDLIIVTFPSYLGFILMWWVCIGTHPILANVLMVLHPWALGLPLPLLYQVLSSVSPKLSPTLRYNLHYLRPSHSFFVWIHSHRY